LIVLPIKINTIEPKRNPHGGGRDVCVLWPCVGACGAAGASPRVQFANAQTYKQCIHVLLIGSNNLFETLY
jgi:hypothetical protein